MNWHTTDYGNVAISRSGLLKRQEPSGARSWLLEYIDMTMEIALFIRPIFYLPLRQTEDFIYSLVRAMKAGITFLISATFPDAAITFSPYILVKAMEACFVIVEASAQENYDKNKYTWKNTMFLLGTPSTNCIVRSIKIIRFRVGTYHAK